MELEVLTAELEAMDEVLDQDADPEKIKTLALGLVKDMLSRAEAMDVTFGEAFAAAINFLATFCETHKEQWLKDRPDLSPDILLWYIIWKFQAALEGEIPDVPEGI